MHFGYAHAIDSTKILTRRELAIVLKDLKRKAPRSMNTWQNLILFRLASCCGLRVSEIASLRINDVCIETRRPHLRIRRGAAKGGKPRMVPLWWDWPDPKCCTRGYESTDWVRSLCCWNGREG